MKSSMPHSDLPPGVQMFDPRRLRRRERQREILRSNRILSSQLASTLKAKDKIAERLNAVSREMERQRRQGFIATIRQGFRKLFNRGKV